MEERTIDSIIHFTEHQRYPKHKIVKREKYPDNFNQNIQLAAFCIYPRLGVGNHIKQKSNLLHP